MPYLRVVNRLALFAYHPPGVWRDELSECYDRLQETVKR